MIIWSGWGFLVAVSFIVSLLFTYLGLAVVTGQPDFYQENAWPKLLAMVVAAVFTFISHIFVTKISKPRVVIDKETGEEQQIGGRNTLFFIPMRFWPIIFVVIGIAALFS